MTDIEGISTWMKCMRNYHSRVITQHQETVAMTSTAESKRVFKSQTALKMKMNERLSVDLACIYIYIFDYPVRWQKLLGSTRSSSTALSYRNCIITLVGGWWGQGIACAFTRCMMKKKMFKCNPKLGSGLKHYNNFIFLKKFLIWQKM